MHSQGKVASCSFQDQGVRSLFFSRYPFEKPWRCVKITIYVVIMKPKVVDVTFIGKRAWYLNF